MRSFPYILVIILLLIQANAQAQGRGGMMRGMQGMGSRMGGAMRMGGGGGGDSLSFEKRNYADDSVNVRFRYLDTARYSGFDSSVSDFYKRVPLKPELIHIGQNGNATRPILFSPLRKPGWDMGFHAFDPYAWDIAETRFMNTTKPFTELGYLVGSKAEQQISILHTQNVQPDWNFVLHYRLVNAPGIFNSQNSNHNNIRFNSDFQTKNQRYHAYLILLSNALQSSENGGIESEDYIINPNPAYDDRFNIPTNMATTTFSSRNFFNVKLSTGNRYVDRHMLLRQQYDFGKKDSIVTDSSVVRYFLPRLRMEHTIHSSGYSYKFFDIQGEGASEFYAQNYGLSSLPDTVNFESRWNVLRNDFSLVQFPDPKNPLQFLKAGVGLVNFSSTPDSLNDVFYNVIAHGEYRNRTRNKKWDALLYGEFYAAGRDIGNYQIQASLQRVLNNIGQLEIGFQNINRSPSYLFQRKTSFPIQLPSQINDENVSAIKASLFLNKIKTRLSFEYFLLSNYTYLRDFSVVDQYAPIFNYVRAGIQKQTKIGRSFNWYLDLFIQQRTGNAPLNLPWLYTRNRFAYEGKPFKNLVLSTGLDLRYISSYFADAYSPVLGQFFYQDIQKISVRPDIAVYANFRIRSFSAFVRVENLNTATLQYGFGFKQNNLAAPLYPMPGMVFRLGIFWNFVN